MSSDNVSCCRSPNCLLKFVVLGTCYAPGSRSQATATSGLGCAGDLCGPCLHMGPLFRGACESPPLILFTYLP